MNVNRQTRSRAACAPDPGEYASAAMQTLQCFAGSLQDHANLAMIRDRLQDIPRRWMTRADEGEDYLLGNVSGDYNYHFTFKLEGGGFFQTGVLVASAENAPGGLPVPLRCKWRRRIGDMPVEIPSVTSNMYQISADDIGTDICVEASPADMDDGQVGMALGEIGPFELDPSTRRSLDNALGTGGNRFIVSQSSTPADRSSLRQDMAVVVANDSVKVTQIQLGAENRNRETTHEYSPDYPKVIIHPLDTCKFQLIMNETRAFHLQAQSRTARDLIALTIRCFHAKKYLPTASVLQELFPVHAIGAPEAVVAGDSHLDECILLERLTKELNRAMHKKDMLEKVLRNTHHEKKQLQAQLEETIRGFGEVINSCEDQLSAGSSSTSAATMEKIQEQFRDQQAQNKILEGQLRDQRKQLDDALRGKKAASAPGGGGGPGNSTTEVMQLREKRDMLKARLHELTSSSGQQRDQADQVHVRELKRLRQELDSLHNEKEALWHQSQEAARARQELQDNFLYVKNQLDKVHLKHSQTIDGNSPEEKEAKKLKEATLNVGEERSRLCMRLESVNRELEKEKSYHESSLERLMQANGKLMDEKNRAEKEVQRLSQLYAESVQNVQQGDKDDQSALDRENSGASSPVSPPADQAEISRLQMEVAKVDESLKKKEAENESLKSRIRKLAVA